MSFKGRQSAYERMRFLPKTGEKRMAMIKELELTRDKERACIDDPILFLLTINKKKKPNKKYEKIIASFVDDRELATPCGYILLHTHNRLMGEHKFPVDCCRFLPDFFTELQKYLPIEMVEYDEWDEHLFACYRKE